MNLFYLIKEKNWPFMNIKKNWDKVAKNYAKLINNTNNSTWHNCLIPTVLDFISSKKKKNLRVLDVCCGEGYLTNLINKCGHDVVGIDISDQLIDLAKRQYKQITFLKSNATMFSKLIEGKFDLIVSNFGFHAMNDHDLEFFLEESKKKLQNGGLLVFSISHPCFYNKSSLNYFEKSAKDIFIKNYGYNQKFYKQIGKDVKVIHFHRTLDWYFNICFSLGYQCVGFKEIFDKKNRMFKSIPYGVVFSFIKNGDRSDS